MDLGRDTGGAADQALETATGGDSQDSVVDYVPDQAVDEEEAAASPDATDEVSDATDDQDAASGGDVLTDVPAPVCTDHVKNGSETDVDCGGSCAPANKCSDGNGCLVAGDCQSGVCSASHICAAPACNDATKNGSETDVDCGGSCAPEARCANNRTCLVNQDCQSGICKASVCVAASCTNGVKDNNETAIDCGGTDCGPCNDGLACALNSDCKSGKCTNLTCAPPSCTDGVKNGTETDVDCGGSCTTKCGLTKLCGADLDCASGHCPSGRCVECLSAMTCPGQDTGCQSRMCNNNACGISYAANNTPLPAQAQGDCHTKRCDGSGGIVDAVDDSDKPIDGNDCTGNVCTNGTPSNPPLPARTTCSQNGGSLCTSGGACVACLLPADCLAARGVSLGDLNT